MRSVWIVAALAGLTAGSALAQGLIPPSHVYSSTPPAPLDKNFGLPKVFTGEPQQKAPTAKTQDEPDPFAGLSTFARPGAQTSDTPDFFAASPGVAAPPQPVTDVPNFFATPPDAVLPKVAKSQAGYSTTDTPLFTTSDGSSLDDRIFERPASGDTMTDDTTSGDGTTPPAR